MPKKYSCLLGVILGLLAHHARAAEVTLEKNDSEITVKIDGELFTRYITASGGKPILWPLVGPTGKEMTRGYPMREATPEEKSDHIHHRSVWFTHGKVNGIDFWSENENHGTIEHREFGEITEGNGAAILARNDWLAPDKKRVCQDERRLRFGGDAEARWFDFDITFIASDGPVVFGDTKEGSFGIRVHETMKVEAKKGGQIVNSEGETDEKAWGRPAAWVDYFGPIEGETLGIAILNHPKSFGYPMHWHVRTYGLFAANPFGLHDFAGGDSAVDGTYTLPANEKLTMRFRVVLHKGNDKEGRIVERFEEYSTQ